MGPFLILHIALKSPVQNPIIRTWPLQINFSDIRCKAIYENSNHTDPQKSLPKFAAEWEFENVHYKGPPFIKDVINQDSKGKGFAKR